MTIYDAIRYPGLPYADTHPDHLAATATFQGLDPVPPDRCRVLEVGCGDGANLVPMAYALPRCTFVGIDLAGDAIESARAFARRAGVRNVTFDPLDLTRFPENAGSFDYIIAHGVYSWVPADVRDALMALIGRHLAPQGVAFVSYNTYPGCRLRQMMWDILKFHTGALDNAQAQMIEAQAMIRLVAHGSVQPDEYTQPLVAEARRMEDRLPALLYHDDLSPVNDPVYFHEFAEHAARHGLQFLAEAAFAASSYAGIAPEARSVLATLDPITRQQYLDFVRCRRFRETLLCRTEIALDRHETLARARTLAFTAARRVRATPQDGVAASATPTTSVTEGDDSGAALMAAILDTLRAAAPHALPLATLLERVRARPEAEHLRFSDNDLDAVALASLQAGVIRPHVHAPPVAFPPGERPVASAVVRAQLAQGDMVTSLWHEPVKVDDEFTKRVLPLLDGSRGRSELLSALGDLPGPETSRAVTLDGRLRHLARLGLLVA